MRLLLTNDDGVYSPGLAVLAEVAARFGDVRIVAPDVEQSSTGQAITAARPLSIRRAKVGAFDAYRVNGTPADCVVLGVSQWQGVEVVLSGINLGPNLGNAMWHSGTLAAAKQAALLGLRGVALSTMVNDDDPTFDELRPCLEEVLKLLLRAETTSPLTNVNFPRHPKGLHWTRQAVRHYDGYIVPGRDPMGREHFWYAVRPIEEVEEGTDLWAIRNSWASLTPLRLDLTDHALLRKVREEHATPRITVKEDAPVRGG